MLGWLSVLMAGLLNHHAATVPLMCRWAGVGRGTIGFMRVGIAHHLGWAVAVTASADHVVLDRRRIELLGPDQPAAPIHHLGGAHAMHASSDALLDDDALADLVAQVRRSAARVTAECLNALEHDLPGPVTSLSVRSWPGDFPTGISALRRVPYESRADSVMYCQVLAEAAAARGWRVHLYDARKVEQEAAHVLGARAQELLHGPRSLLGAPWTKDHRMALAATVVAP